MLKLSNKQLINTYLHSATYSGQCDENGIPNTHFFDLYTKIAEGNPAVIIMQHAYVLENGKMSQKQLSISNDELVSEHRKIIDAIRKVNDKIFIVCQLAHGGCKAFSESKYDLNTMSEDDFNTVQNAFLAASKRAILAGYDAVQIHSAHQYLLSESISTGYNQRTDKFNAKDALLLKNIFADIKATGACVGVKIQSNDFMVDTGVNYQFCYDLLKQISFDFIEISGGGRDPRSSFLTGRQGQKDSFYYREMIEMMQKDGFLEKNFVIVTGGFQSTADAQRALDMGCKLVGFCRKFIRNPTFLQHDNLVCIRCNQCSGKCAEAKGISCILEGGYGF